mmetsp:Transcript_24907/g.59137  ORF Transcript_24907/g.59137 Transcript_24907/m.59137 type:complete len:463 (+) Transcript_24907:88-1476(+)
MDRGENRNAALMSSSCFKLCVLVVDRFYFSICENVYPDPDTAKIMAFGGSAAASLPNSNNNNNKKKKNRRRNKKNSVLTIGDDDEIDGDDPVNEASRNMFGALTSLHKNGRLSRSMLELALIHSSTSFPHFIQRWICSLPPDERNLYAADLYNSKFSNVPWDVQFYKHTLQDRRVDYDGTSSSSAAAAVAPTSASNASSAATTITKPESMPAPPTPIGDNRHSPRAHSIQHAAYFWYQVLEEGVLFGDHAGNDGVVGGGEAGDNATNSILIHHDYHRPLAADYVDLVEPDILSTLGPVFGIVKSDLVFGQRSDNKTSNGSTTGKKRTMSPSERILRLWNVLYQEQRLSKTELEDVLRQGPWAVRAFLERGALLIRLTYSIAGYGDDDEHPTLDIVRGDIVTNPVVFQDLPISQDILKECDFCGESLDKVDLCSKCKVAMYCSRECQRQDWKRHKSLCCCAGH